MNCNNPAKTKTHLRRSPPASFQDALLLSLETIGACLSGLNADDESLRATVALRLAILQADFRGDRRKACQVNFVMDGLESCHNAHRG